LCVFFFFFQAEDGIRDLIVTGVQTCALPISLNGIDVLVKNNFAPLKGKRIGLVTNHTGHDRDRRPTIDLLQNAPGVTLVALFSPEHGIRGERDGVVADATNEINGLAIYSLFGKTHKPTPKQIESLDA